MIRLSNGVYFYPATLNNPNKYTIFKSLLDNKVVWILQINDVELNQFASKKTG